MKGDISWLIVALRVLAAAIGAALAALSGAHGAEPLLAAVLGAHLVPGPKP